MKNQRNGDQIRKRVNLVNRYILIVALLWVAVLVALLLKAHPGVVHSKVDVKNYERITVLRSLPNSVLAATLK